MRIQKRCTCCGHRFERIPEDARFHDDNSPLRGFYWECRCGSTLFVPADRAA